MADSRPVSYTPEIQLLSNQRAYSIEIYCFSNGPYSEANSTIKFPAFVTDYKETYSSAWNEEPVYGRMDDIPIYQKTTRMIQFDLDLPYLKELWESQNGKCVITGVDLNLSPSSNKNYQASLDRIDSSKGYTEDNVQWIHKDVNFLKQDFSEKELLEWCQKLIDHRNKKILEKS